VDGARLEQRADLVQRRIVVDLPDPFGPRNPVTMPGRTVKLSPSTARFSP
jgi:hypothetical protein